jgi:hypothetical protein
VSPLYRVSPPFGASVVIEDPASVHDATSVVQTMPEVDEDCPQLFLSTKDFVL